MLSSPVRRRRSRAAPAHASTRSSARCWRARPLLAAARWRARPASTGRAPPTASPATSRPTATEDPRTALQEVGTTGHRLWAPAGQALEGLLAEAARDGVRIGITDSYRSYDAQVDVAARKGLYSQGGLAAEPGTSPHGWGIAVDLDLDDRAQAWMRTNGGRFGFVEDTPREPWHWVYRS